MPDLSEVKNTAKTAVFWTERYKKQQTGWNIGTPSTPLKAYFDQLTDKNLRILIPGAGNAYEAEYLFLNGFRNVFVLDIAKQPLDNLQQRVPHFPSDQLIHANFFEHEGEYDIIIEQTFFCSFPPSPINRKSYAEKMTELLVNNGKLVGLWFQFPLNAEKPPYGGSSSEYLTYFEPLFEVKVLEKCNNSIPSRIEKELFGIFVKK